MNCVRLFALLLFCTVTVQQQQQGFVYPRKLPAPTRLYLDFFVPSLHYKAISTHEASVVMYQLARVDEAMWNCIAVYSSEFLDATTQQRPIVTVPAAVGHSSRARGLCMVYSVAAILPAVVNDAVNDFNTQAANHGVNLNLDAISRTVSACNGEPNCLRKTAQDNNFTPKVMGVIVGDLITRDTKTDGWNADGRLDQSGEECTSNCARFGDTTNYRPVNSPWGPQTTDSATWFNWQPLLEHDHNGFTFRQMHVTPHIGFTARPMVIRDLADRFAPEPNYDYVLEVSLAVQRVAELNEWRKMAVELLDNKIKLMVEIHQRLRAKLRWSLEEAVWWQLGYSAAMHDSVLVAWKEKIRYDRARTTTLIHNMLPQTTIKSWAGPYQPTKEIQAQHWQPYVRIMPHSEYPSGSSCICKVIQEFVDKYLITRGEPTKFDPSPIRYAQGSSKIEPGVKPEQEVLIDFEDMTDVKNMCQQSRLWGGQHFTAAPVGAEVACREIGYLSFDYVTKLLGTGVLLESSSRLSVL